MAVDPILGRFSNALQNPGEDLKTEKQASMIGNAFQMAGGLAQSGIDSGNTDNNVKFGSQSESAKGMKSTVGNAIGSFNPVFGAIFKGADAIGGTVGSALNRKNAYNKYGYNEKETRGTGYMQLGGLFDPFSMGVRALEKGGKGSGLRALAGFTGLGGHAQFKYEQEQALEAERLDEMKQDSLWNLSQYNYSPNIDV